MNEVLILGPISDFGGREVEVQLIASGLEKNFNVKILSTGNITTKSFGKEVLKQTKVSSLHVLLYKKYRLLRCIAFLLHIKNKKKRSIYEYTNNHFSKKYLSFNKKRNSILKEEICKSDLVILTMHLTSNFLKESIEYCFENKIPCLVRTTETISTVKPSLIPHLKKVSCFIHHSKANADNLQAAIKHKYSLIDQCALNETMLLNLPISITQPLRFGYLGRLSSEKQVLQLASFFSSSNNYFVIAGDGPLKASLKKIIENKKNCEYLGLIENDKLNTFFEKIDVLIISSTHESGPIVGLEAMAAGKLIITTKVGAMEERLESMGSLPFLEYNLDNLNDLIGYLKNSDISDLKNKSLKLREHYINNYSQKIIEKEYIDIVKKHI